MKYQKSDQIKSTMYTYMRITLLAPLDFRFLTFIPCSSILVNNASPLLFVHNMGTLLTTDSCLINSGVHLLPLFLWYSSFKDNNIFTAAVISSCVYLNYKYILYTIHKC